MPPHPKPEPAAAPSQDRFLSWRLSRRRFMASLTTVSAAAILAKHAPQPADGFVEINGWILKRSDLA